MAILTNPKPTIYRNLYEDTWPVYTGFLLMSNNHTHVSKRQTKLVHQPLIKPPLNMLSFSVICSRRSFCGRFNF